MFGITRRRSSLGLSVYPLMEEEPGPGDPGTGRPRRLRRIISIEEDHMPQLLEAGFEQPLHQCPEEEEEGSPQDGEGQALQAAPLEVTPMSPRGQPVGKEALSKVRAYLTLPGRKHWYGLPLVITKEVECGRC